MECGCKQQTTQLFIEGEYGADPVWCSICQYNIDMDDLAISDTLYNDLLNWANAYGQWVDLMQETLVEDGEQMQAAHNKQGIQLAARLQQELNDKVKVSFNASNM